MDDLDSALGGDLRTVVELASLAPSVHNTQPWRFTWDGSALSVYEDRSRALPVLDPTGRERLVSCGAAVLHARLALAELGHGSTTVLLPDPADEALLARITVDGRCDPTAEEHALATAIPRRTTDRDPFDDRAVPSQARDALRRAAEAEGGWLRFLRDEDDDTSVELQVLLSHADTSQLADAAYLAAWRRDREAEGVPARALPSVPAELRGSSWVPRDFDAAAVVPGSGQRSTEPPTPEHPAVLVLGHPQMLLRVGYGHVGPTSRRRSVEQILTVVPPAG